MSAKAAVLCLVLACSGFFAECVAFAQTPADPSQGVSTPIFNADTDTGTQNPDADAGLSDARLRASGSAAPLTLDQAIALTLLHNPSRAVAQAALAAALAAVGTAKAAEGVQANLQAGGSVTGYSGGAPSLNDRFAGLGAQFSPDTSGALGAGTRSARANARAAAAQVLVTEQNLVLTATQAYLAILQTEELLAVADGNLAVSREQQRVAQARFDEGVASRLDLLRTNTVLDAAQQNRISASQALAQADAALNILMGRVAETPLQVAEITSLDLTVPVPGATPAVVTNGSDVSPGAFRAVADQNSPQLAGDLATIQAGQAGVDVAKGERRPSTTLTLSSLLSAGTALPTALASALGLNVVQDLFDSGKSHSDIAAARAVVAEDRGKLSEDELTIGDEIEDSLLSLDAAQKQLDKADSAVADAGAEVAAAQAGFEAGTLSSLDVSDAQSDLLSAQTLQVDARFAYANAQASLAAAIGVLTGEANRAYEQVVKTDTVTNSVRRQRG